MYMYCLLNTIDRPEAPTPTPSTCAGKRYTITAGDDCYEISKVNSIGTAWLLSDNNLAAYCSGFPTSGELCIENTCKVYTVKPDDTCDSMAESNNITVAQLKAWNPVSYRSLFYHNTIDPLTTIDH